MNGQQGTQDPGAQNPEVSQNPFESLENLLKAEGPARNRAGQGEEEDERDGKNGGAQGGGEPDEDDYNPAMMKKYMKRFMKENKSFMQKAMKEGSALFKAASAAVPPTTGLGEGGDEEAVAIMADGTDFFEKTLEVQNHLLKAINQLVENTGALHARVDHLENLQKAMGTAEIHSGKLLERLASAPGTPTPTIAAGTTPAPEDLFKAESLHQVRTRLREKVAQGDQNASAVLDAGSAANWNYHRLPEFARRYVSSMMA